MSDNRIHNADSGTNSHKSKGEVGDQKKEI